MKKLYLLMCSLVGMLLIFLVNAHQTNFIDQNHLDCATDQLMQQWLEANPKKAALQQKLEEQWVEDQLANSDKVAPPPYVLPVVFHVIHDSGPENISDALVQAGLDHLNEAFANTGYYDQDTGFVTQIQFCLARRDPEEGATTGINRIQNNLTELNADGQDLSLKNLIRWDPTQYINVWLVREICNNNGCGVAGYAYLPSAHGSTVDGIVMEARFMGSSEANSAVLIHEMGHYLGLRHTFQGGCVNNDCLTDGDRVCDTPPDQSTAAVPCGGSANSCSTDTNSGFTTDQDDMYINYMDYGDFNCYSAFTQGQTERMWFFIDNTRSSLLDSPACLDPCPNPITAGFNADATTIAAGGTVNFTNTSVNGMTFNWLIDGVSFANTPNANYTFSTTGVYEIMLEVASSDPLCLPQSVSMSIEVFCPVETHFIYPLEPYLVGATIDFTSDVTAVDDYNWTINNTSLGTTPNLTYTFDQAGIFQVCLQGSNALCDDAYCEYIFIDNNPGGPCEEPTFIKTIGEPDQVEGGNLVIPANDGNLYVAGFRGGEVWLGKVDIGGVFLWQRTINLSTTTQRITDLLQDSDGNLIGIGDVGTGLTSRGFAFKYDPIGDVILWSKLFNGGVKAIEVLEPTPTGPYLVVGNVVDAGNGTDGASFTELDRNTGALGTLNREYNYGASDNFLTTVIHNNSFFTTGRYTNGIGVQNMRMSLSRFTMNGTEQWSYIYNMPFGNNARLYGRDMLIRQDMIYTTYSGDDDGSSINVTNFFLTKTDLQGTPQWTRKYDIPTFDSEWVEKIVEVFDGFVMMGLSRNNDQQLFLVKTDFDGQVVWAKSYGGPNIETFPLNTQHHLLALGEYLVFTAQSNSYGVDEDILLVKTDGEGNVLDECIAIEELEVEVINIPQIEAMQVSLNITAANISVQDGAQELTEVNFPDFTLEGCECEPGSNEDCGDEFYFTIGNGNDNEEIARILPLSDGSFIAGGYQNNNAILFWFDPDGQLVKQKVIPFTSLRPRFSHLSLDDAGFLVGLINSDVVGDDRQNVTFKYDLGTDQLVWTQSFVGSSNNRATLSTFIQHPQNGRYMIFGDINPAPSPGLGCDGVFFELDPNSGVLLNDQAYNLGSCESFFKTILWQNDLYHVGRYNFSGGGQNKFRPGLTKTDLNGVQDWSRLYLVDVALNARLYVNGIVPEGNTLTMAGFGDLNGTEVADVDLYIYQTDLEGNILVAKTIHVPGVNTERGVTLQPGPTGYYFLAYVIDGGQDENVLMKFDDNLDLEWAKRIGGEGADNPRDLVWSGAYLYLGGSTNSFGGSEDGFIARLTPDGEISGNCDYVQEVDVQIANLANPYDGLHPLSQHSPNLNFQAENPPVNDAEAVAEALCTSACPEICDNGVDDDEDGLVDCFDEDCGCSEPCEDYYYTAECDEDCFGGPYPSVFSIDTLWESEQTVANWGLPVVGDLDADGIPEVVSFRSDGPGYAFDGATGLEKYSYTYPGIVSGSVYASIGNLDGDPEGEVVVWQDNDIRVYEHDGTLKWSVPRPFSTQLRVSGIFDINQDGIPEIVFGTYIFSSIDGTLLVQGSGSSGTNLDYPPIGIVAVADVLSEADCGSPNCRGLELIAGPDVYSVVIASYTDPALNQIQVERTLPNYGDGYTSIADLDEDGNLDIIVAGHQRFGNLNRGVYAWSPQTESLIRPFWVYPEGQYALGRPSISDFDNDGELEIAVHGGTEFAGRLQVIDNDLINTLWVLSTNDISGATGATAFDFNGDGESEVIYRDEGQFYIVNGATGAVLETFPCTSGTVVEYPVVADINADGQTEVVCNCGGTPDIVNVARITAWASAGSPWVAARPVWNQHTYFNTNVEDDLDIPIIQQQPHLVGDGDLNYFLQQYANPENPLPDATVDVDSLACGDGFLQATFEVCNIGDQVLSYQTPIVVYDNDPRVGPAVVLTSGLTLGESLLADSCISMTIELPLLPNEYHVVVNDDGSLTTPYDLEEDFPVGPIAECDYLNNVRGFVFEYNPADLDLGPDIDICENGIFTLEADEGFVSYTWPDGSTDMTFTGFEPGTYWVVAIDQCGFAQSDTVVVTEIAAPVLDIGADTLVCPGDTLCLVASGFDSYQWFPPQVVDCPDCDTVKIVTDTAVLIRLVGSTDLGCISVDSLQINIGGESSTLDTLGLCPGDTLSVFGMEVTAPGTFTDSIINNNCLVISTIEVVPLDTVLTMEDLAICEGDSIQVFGDWVTEAGTYSDVFTSQGGCDSTHIVNLEVNPLVFTFDTLSICEGDSILIFDEYQSESGDYEEVFESSVGCDSMHTITLELLPTSSGSDTLTICQGDSVLIFGQYEQSAGLYAQTFTAANGCDSIHETTLEVLDTIVTLEEQSICVGDSILIFGNWQTEAGDYSASFTSENGCDSVATITLEVLQSTSSEENITICSGDSILIFGNYESEGGIYSQVFTGANGCDSTHTIELITETITLDYSILVPCTDRDNGVVVIIAEGGTEPYSYSWLPGGDLGPIVEHITAGNYSVTVTDAIGCQAVINFTVEEVEPETFNFTANRPGCAGDQDGSIDLIGAPGMQFSLDGTSFQPVEAFYGLTAGEYLVISEDQNGCRDTASVVVEDPEEMWLELPEDQTIKLGENVTINSQSNAGPLAEYTWKPLDSLSCGDCPRTIAGPAVTTEYTLTVVDSNGCTASDDIRIFVDRRRNVYIPNAFSPNGDGVNDYFIVYGDESVRQVRHLMVFDRWGEMVFDKKGMPINDPMEGWDGQLNGRLMKPSVFVYMAEVEFIDGTIEIFEGEVILLR